MTKFQVNSKRKLTVDTSSAQLDLGARLKLWLLAGLFAALTAVGAWLRLPLPTGVPLTLQTFFVLLAGGVLGPRYGALSQLLYLSIGLSGIPVFAEGGGLAYVARPTFGYLAAYPIAAFVVGTLSSRHNRITGRYWTFAAANVTAVGVIFFFGVSYLYLNLRLFAGTEIAWPTIVWTGAIIFLPGDLLKVMLAAMLQARLRPLLFDRGGAAARLTAL